MNLYMILLSQVFQSFSVRHLLMLHNEVNRAAAFAATEAVAYSLCLRHAERWRLFIMKWAQTYVVSPTTFEANEI